MIASHNSMSYLKPTKLRMKILTPWSKCQDLTIQSQLDKGVRYFDIRIRPHKKGDTYIAHYCHNNIDYGVANLKDSLGLIDVYSANRIGIKYFVRVTLDVREKPDDAEAMSSWFKEYIEKAKETYHNILFDSIKIFWDWHNDLGPQTVTVTEKHWSVVDKSWYEYPKTLKGFAEKYNSTFIEEFNKKYSAADPDKYCLMIDFIEKT